MLFNFCFNFFLCASANHYELLRTIIFYVPELNRNGTFIYGMKQKPQQKTFRSDTLAKTPLD